MDDARKLQQLSINMISLLGKYGGIGTGKTHMEYFGLDCGEFRLPVKNMDLKMIPLLLRK
jgi:N-acetylneuraminate lyase